VDVMVDGAHAFAHFEYRIPDTHADYYGASLHKWLGCPLGTGILYVRKDKIRSLWPVYGDSAQFEDTDVMKLNHTGTHPVASDLAIGDAIDFHNTIGTPRKEARLRYLQNYWTSKVRGMKNVVLNTPTDPARSCAIANVGVTGVKPADLAATLLDKYKVWTAPVDNAAAGVHGVRVTPHVFILPRELDVLVKGIAEISRTV
jgi:selenocysteine lyase/cysteine desulfurase